MSGESPADPRHPTDVLDSAEAGGRAIRGGTLRVAGYVAGTLVTLVSVPLLVRHLGVADFGRYVTVVSLVAIVAGVTEGGLGAVAVREYAALTGRERGGFMRDVLGARIVLTLLGVVGAVLFAVAAGYGSDMVLGTALAGLGLVVAVVQGTHIVPLVAGLRLGWITTFDLLRALLNAILVVGLVLAGAGIVAFLAVPLPAAAVVAFVTVVVVRRQIPLVPSFHPARWLRILRDTLPLAAATALGTLYFRMAILLMSLTAVAVETGYFATSYRVIEALGGIPVLLVGVTFPVLARAARDDRERLRYAAQRIFEIALIGGVWMSLATALGAAFAMEVIGGDEAAPATSVLRVQALFMIPAFIGLTWQTLLLALRMHGEMFVSALVALAVLLVLSLALIPPLEAQGAAVAVVISETVLMAIQALLLWRTHPRLRPSFAAVPRVALAAGVAVGAALAIDVHEAVRVVLATVVYFGLLALLRAIPTELVGALRGRPVTEF
jgi:O-antigen/teichoic acid export membrane protein